jgi:putative ATP-dependent endonuclease of the OLD family
MAKAPVEQAPEGKIRKLTISNFRGIGTKPVEIEIDDIVVLVGPNNSGKSSILRAYEIVMEGSSKNGQLSIDDFPNGQVIIENLPTIIVETIVENDKNVSGRWISHSDQGLVIKEKFTWSSPKSSPEIVGFLSKENRWATKEDSPHRPFGAPNIAQSRRPRPISVHAFQSPEKQAEEVNKVA